MEHFYAEGKGVIAATDGSGETFPRFLYFPTQQNFYEGRIHENGKRSLSVFSVFSSITKID